MHLVTVATLFSLQFCVGHIDVSAAVNSVGSLVADSYLVTLRSSDPRYSTSSPHTILYSGLTSLDLTWTTKKEYSHRALTGAIIEFDRNTSPEQLVGIPGVESVIPIRSYQAPQVSRSTPSKRFNKRANGTPWTHTLTGVDRLHTENIRGQGITIGIIDSGIDFNHRALGEGFGPEYKVIGGHDFVGNDYTGGPDGGPPQPSEYPLDLCNGHGTSVAGVIGANPGVRPGITGVAPEASLNVYRVSGCEGTTSDEIIIDALLRADQDENDIITISIRIQVGLAWSAAAVVANRIARSGRVVTLSGSNDWDEGFWRGWNVAGGLCVISVGNVQKFVYHVQDAAANTDGIVMAPISGYGPTNDMHLLPTLSAPGFNILTTVPVPLGEYEVVSGTSLATPFVAGSIALWLQVKGRSRNNARAACAAFQNTAVPLHRDRQGGGSIETAARQGAGLIHTYNAIRAASSIYPSEILLNDTINFKSSWRVKVQNRGGRTVVYRMMHVPAGTVPTMQGIESIVGTHPLLSNSATVVFSRNMVMVPPRSTRYVTVRFEPPTGLDGTTFPVYSGYIIAVGPDGSMFQSTYLGLATSLKRMRVIDNTNMHLGVQLPHIRAGNGNILQGPTTFSLNGNDMPRLVFRLVGPTPQLRIDLIEGGATVRPSRGQNRLSCFRILCGEREFGGARIIARIYRAHRVPRHALTQSENHPETYRTLRIAWLANGMLIPNGNYKFLLRALRMTGNPRRESDWDVWTSPQIYIQRA